MPFDIRQYQPRAWSILSRGVVSGRTASTYLLHGPEGVGQWPMAISFAALLNCPQPISSEDSKSLIPCGECASCRQIFHLNSPGLFLVVPIMSFDKVSEAIELTNAVLDEKREEPFKILTAPRQISLSIDMAREVKKHLMLKETDVRRRVVLFYQMEKMLTASADVLLKLIEEPPADTVILLTAERPESLLPTIQSRSQHIRLHRVPEAAAIQYLVDKYEQDPRRAKLLVRLAEQNLGRAVELCSSSDDGDESNRAIGLMLFKSLFHDNTPQATFRLQDLLPRADKSDVEQLLHLWQSLTRDCANYAVNGDEAELTNIDFLPEISACAGRFSNAELSMAFMVAIKNALADLKRNVHIQIALTALVIRLTRTIRQGH
ncbi:MAG: hypothetical protein WAU88_10145 [Candidatus Zixiibacteriota bacterium]